MTHRTDLSSSFPDQLLAKEPTVKDLAKILIVENSTMAASFTDVCTAFLLYLTIPVEGMELELVGFKSMAMHL